MNHHAACFSYAFRSLVTDALDDFADEVSAAQASEVSSVKQEVAAAAEESNEENGMQEVRTAGHDTHARMHSFSRLMLYP